MITKSLVTKLKREIEKADSGRSRIIRETNGLIRDAKQAIFSLHRNDSAIAEKSLVKTGVSLARLIRIAEKDGLRGEATLKAAIEEFLEADYLLRVIKNQSLNARYPFKPMADEQLAALSDLTGELVRAATLEVTHGNSKRVKLFRDATDELFGVLLSMNLRGSLRQKRDDARRNLRRLEEILYDVSLRNQA